MIIQPAKPEDATRLTALAHAAKGYWGYPERWMQAWEADLAITPSFIRDHTVFIASEDHDLHGCYALMLNPPIASLEHFWVHPEAMGRGIGRSLFEHALSQATRPGIERMEIESDPNAEAFYQHLGARRIGEHVYQLEGQPRVLPVMEFTISSPEKVMEEL